MARWISYHLFIPPTGTPHPGSARAAPRRSVGSPNPSFPIPSHQSSSFRRAVMFGHHGKLCQSTSPALCVTGAPARQVRVIKQALMCHHHHDQVSNLLSKIQFGIEKLPQWDYVGRLFLKKRARKPERGLSTGEKCTRPRPSGRESLYHGTRNRHGVFTYKLSHGKKNGGERNAGAFPEKPSPIPGKHQQQAEGEESGDAESIFLQRRV